MVRPSGAEDLHHARQQPVGAGAHVDWLDGKPDGVEADHRSSSRIQAAHSAAAPPGQLTLIVVALRRNSMRMSTGCGSAGASPSGTNVVGATSHRS